jgi:cytochrome bd ubiquinol oxidase subunit II
MSLNTLWFILIAILYIGFFILEGFDFGVGILLPFLGKKDAERRMIINTIGPHWDGNEVWLLTAGGATFAAFPEWYATMFSAFYLPLFLLLVGLIFRGIAFEFRSKDDNLHWRTMWDWCICLGSLISALLLGVAFANIVKGIPIDAEMQYTGGFFNLLNPYALLGGVSAVLLFTLHGAIFLTMKTTGVVLQRAQTLSSKLWLPVLLVMIVLLAATYFATDIVEHLGVFSVIVPLVGIVALLVAGYFLRKQKNGWAFGMTCITIAFSMIAMFLTMYPRVLISSLNPAWSLTIDTADSSAYTLQIMTIVALVFVPIVLIYQGWSYWVFRKRVSEKPQELTY